MLEPMTLATMVLMGASKLSGSVSHVAKRRWGKTLPSADATPGSEEERFLLLQRINKTPDGVARVAAAACMLQSVMCL
jgi:hypothetical protein